ncbi:MAG: Fic family protein [Gemmatimonadales bacterium]
MNRGVTGEYRVVSTVGGETVRAFVPVPLPPRPTLDLDPPLRELLDETLIALGRLDGASSLFPDTDLFLYAYVRKEAVLSSQIEGTQSSLSDLLLFELEEVPGVPISDVTEVSNYVAALDHGLTRIRDGFPISARLIRELHQRLLRSGRGAKADAGEFRRSQNWIGGSRPGNAAFVPPPPEAVADCIAALERFLHDHSERTPTLIKAALAHVQFETIHPFLDGNGRVGRLLITMLLCAEGVLRYPLLYLSLYFKHHRQRYYELLTEVRTTGNWEAWLEFFARGTHDTANRAVATARSIGELFRTDRERLTAMGRSAGSAFPVHHEMQRRPLATVKSLIKATGLTAPTVGKALDVLVRVGIAREITGRRRGRVFGYDRYLALMSEGTEPL